MEAKRFLIALAWTCKSARATSEGAVSSTVSLAERAKLWRIRGHDVSLIASHISLIASLISSGASGATT
jgi:hypothetical protein